MPRNMEFSSEKGKKYITSPETEHNKENLQRLIEINKKRQEILKREKKTTAETCKTKE